MDLIKTITEVQNYVAINATSNIGTLRPYFRLAQRNYLVPVLGTAFLDDLVILYTDAAFVVSAITDEKDEKAVSLAQEVIANLGTLHALPILSVQVGANGIQVVKNDQMAPASQWRTEQVFDSLSEVGHQAIDALLTYLDQEKSHFSVWAADPVYQNYKKYFIRTAPDFNQHYNIKDSRYLFHVIQYCMARVEEFEIKKAVGVTLFDYLKAQDLSGSISAKYKILLTNYLKPAIALFTIAKALRERLIEIKAGSITIRFTGSNTENMYESRAPQTNELDTAIASLLSDAQNWIAEAQTYISENPESFEAYATVITSRKRMNAKNNNPGLTIF